MEEQNPNSSVIAETEYSQAKQLPSLSIIFPTHNEECLLARALTNVLAVKQEYRAEVEIIVACNGCIDRSVAISRLYPVQVIEDKRAGMSFGNNLGGKLAKNELLLFWDVDTVIAQGGLLDFAKIVQGKNQIVGGFNTLPDKVYPRSNIFYWIMNYFCRKNQAPPAGTVFISRDIYQKINGFDESIPQGTASDITRRAVLAGAEFVFIETSKCRTSVRRFEKRGYARQLFEWRRNIRCHKAQRKDIIVKHDYEVIR